MIKRLFRTWLRVQLYKKIGESINFEEAFLWIYNTPIFEWKLRIYCVRSSSDNYDHDKNAYRAAMLTDLNEASRLWNFFHK